LGVAQQLDQGKWCTMGEMHKIRSQDLITDSPVELHRVLNDPKLEIGAPCPLNDVLFSVPYQHRREFVQSHHKGMCLCVERKIKSF
jgi:hypothetical protein